MYPIRKPDQRLLVGGINVPNDYLENLLEYINNLCIGVSSGIKTRPGYTDEKIETILDDRSDTGLKFINYVHAVVMEEMDWDFD